MSRVGGGAAARVLAGALRLLPPHRADWARAMRAELAAIDAPAARWRFLLGCLRVVAIQRMTVRSVGRLVLVAGALAGALVLTRDVADVALRVGLVALVAVPLAVSWLARRRWLFGPAAGGWTAGLVGAGGYLLVGALVLNAVVNLRDPVGVPVYPVLLTGYLVGFLALTAHRGAATGRVLAAGALSGLGAAALWLAIVLAAPPVPANIVLAVELTAVAMVAAGFVGRSPVAALWPVPWPCCSSCSSSRCCPRPRRRASSPTWPAPRSAGPTTSRRAGSRSTTPMWACCSWAASRVSH